MPRLLLVEDDIDLGIALQRSLNRSGLATDWVRRVADTDALLATAGYSAAILDVELPDGSGLDILARMRENGDRTPVLILTVRYFVSERVRALDSGADDYLLKPFSMEELLARVRALIRRAAGQAAPMWNLGSLQVDPTRQQVHCNGRLLDLSTKEFELLLELIRHHGEAVSRTRLEKAVFRSPESIQSNLLEVHIHNLRRKLPSNFIKTVRGVGYMLTP